MPANDNVKNKVSVYKLEVKTYAGLKINTNRELVINCCLFYNLFLGITSLNILSVSLGKKLGVL